ncbi:cytochrome P450 / NADPH-cytochrome P450 reductase [Mesorhizobium albiziae]|uniref:Bifunctional cytochrome P450/NADPH--P450 reductase n=1 Tax=Neomesorhizobium albiziae TaxID=335020 RepID=A0A1I3V171_9HYPH|nr:cytochrome P450 [Mesorhizobium albiziae]GLS28610.1 NADPH--cytochrome P450 reductase [Mesorhizobium albiziae]SFJ89178.1 cytochrome P450 / NADPH-cytochrome P450 reductase [Mesorhizobium albiziae]
MAPANALHPIPNPAGKPLIGNMLTVDSDAPLQSLMQLTREHGPIYWLNMMGTPLVVVSGASLVEEICDETRFDKAVRGPLRRIRALAGDGLFTGDTQEPNWGKAHNILLPTFAQRAMAGYLPLMYDIAEQLCTKWERLNADDEVDVVHDMTALALDTIGICGFDYRFNSFYRRDYHPFIDALTRTLETCMVQRGLPFEKVILTKRLNQLKEDVAFMNKLVDDIIRERRRGGDQSQKDLLNFMLAGVDKVTGESLSDENIRYQINTFLIAGHETTSGLLSFTLYFLVNNADVLARAYEEVDRVLGNDLAMQPTIGQVNQLTYVQQILNEALRLYPTAPAIGLYPYKDEVIGGQYKIKKGTFITLLTLMLHRDPSVWGPNPEVFNPDNFSREAEASRPPNAFKPWGNGQRACIGRQFAMQEATMVLGMILQRFQLFDHKKYQLKIKETLSIKPDGFTIKVKPRPGRTRSAVVLGAALASQNDNRTQVETARRPSHGTKATVLFGSNLGTTEELARAIANSAELNGFDTRFADLDSCAGNLPTEGAVIIASASYNGAPPDNAAKFVKWLNEAQPGAAAGVNYLVFGCGNRDWASTFQATPRHLDERLEALGGSRIVARGEGDAREDLDGQFQDWFKKLWPQVGAALKLDIDFSEEAKAEPLYAVEVVSGAPLNPAIGQAGAVAMKIAANRELQDVTASGRSTRHIEVALPEGQSYQPGDHLCVVPVNSPALVERVEKRFGFAPDTQIRLTTTGGRHAPFPVDGPLSVRGILSSYVELQHVATRKQIRTMAEQTRCPVTKPELERLASEASDGVDAYKSEVFARRKSVLDLLEEFPACELPFGLYLEMLPVLSPRYYSISSSPNAEPDRCAITVGVVEGEARAGNGIYKGVCSTHLVDCGEGSTIHASIKETKAGFRLPENPQTPLIMIGPGTGLAPFRAFLQERQLQAAQAKKLGPAMLFFGCRHPDQDFLYRPELEEMAGKGLVELHVAFSRHGGEKTYVQDLLRKNRSRVWELIEAGAHIYVCGDGSRMEPDVKRALAMLYAEAKDTGSSAADAWMEQMSRDNRYVLDVWAGN